jgi:DNA-binding NarL/FixJ family response regulator
MSRLGPPPHAGWVTERPLRRRPEYPWSAAMSEMPSVPQRRADDSPVIRVLIVEDHQMFAEALAKSLQSERDIRVVGLCRMLEDAREFLRHEHADVVLMDYNMPDGDGVAAARYIREEHPRTRVIVVSAAEERAVLYEALEAGCNGFLGKSESMVHLASAIRGAMVGNVAISPEMAARLVAPGGRWQGYGDALTPRELDVLRLMTRGASNAMICQQLFMSEGTLRNKIARINSKLGVHSKLEAVTRGLRMGLIDLETEEGNVEARVVLVPRQPS